MTGNLASAHSIRHCRAARGAGRGLIVGHGVERIPTASPRSSASRTSVHGGPVGIGASPEVTATLQSANACESIPGGSAPSRRRLEWHRGERVFFVELLEGVLEDEATDLSIWKATRGSGASTKLAEDLLAVYASAVASNRLEPIPEKAADQFRPAYLSDYQGNGITPYDREFRFVDTALFYADSVAVEDELLVWQQHAEDPRSSLRVHWESGSPECDNATWLARRIARYGELERRGLLYYVDPPTRRSRHEVAAAIDWRAADELTPLVGSRKRYVEPFRSNPELMRPDLTVWLGELFAMLDHTQTFTGYVDLHLPSWCAGPELLDWWWRQEESSLSLDRKAVLRQRSLTRLLSLPALSDSGGRELSLRQQLAVREAEAFQLWRADLEEALAMVVDSPSIFETADFNRRLDDHVQRLSARVRQTKSLRDTFTETIVTGVAAGGAGAALGEPPVATIATAVAPFLVQSVPRLSRWLTAGRQVSAMEGCYRLFMDGNGRTVTGALAYDSPPSNYMVDWRGRPLHDSMLGLGL